jgi:integrase
MASRPYFDKRRGNWVCKYRPDPAGPWVRVVLCKHPGDWSPSRPPRKPPQAAIDRAREFAEVEYRARHGLGAAPERAKGLGGYLADYVSAYEGTHAAGSLKQLKRYVESFAAFATARGVTTVQGVTRATCRDYLEARVKQAAHATVKAERGYLIGIWTRAVEDELIAANPWTFARVPGEPDDVPVTFWTSDQVAAIARCCAKPWQSDLVLVLANTGLRVSTALAMTRGWVDWGAGTITIPRGERIKTRYKHVLGRAAREILSRRLATSKDTSGLVFPNPLGGGVVPYDTVRAATGRAIRKAGVPAGTVHDLRHTYGRALAAAGIPMHVIQAQLGHSSLRMTERYSTADEATTGRFVAEFSIGVPVTPGGPA